MEVSRSVEQRLAASNKLAKSLTTHLRSMGTVVAPWRSHFEHFIDDFYRERSWDKFRFGVRHTVVLQQLNEFSLVDLSRHIENQARQLELGRLNSYRAQGDAEGVGRDIRTSLEAFDNTAFVAVAAVSSICLALGAFEPKAVEKIDQKFVSQRLAPGLTLHIYGCSSVVRELDSSDETPILMGKLAYDLAWSNLQEKEERGASFLNGCTKQGQLLQRQFQSFERAFGSNASISAGANGEGDYLFVPSEVLKRMLRQYQAQIDGLAAEHEMAKPGLNAPEQAL